MASKMKPIKGVTVKEIQIGTISADKFSVKSKDSNAGIILYLHGGGYMMGSCKSYRRFISIVCKKLHLGAISIDYGLAPGNPFPAGLDEAFFTYKWLLEERSIPAENIIIMGFSRRWINFSLIASNWNP